MENTTDKIDKLLEILPDLDNAIIKMETEKNNKLNLIEKEYEIQLQPLIEKRGEMIELLKPTVEEAEGNVIQLNESKVLAKQSRNTYDNDKLYKNILDYFKNDTEKFNLVESTFETTKIIQYKKADVLKSLDKNFKDTDVEIKKIVKSLEEQSIKDTKISYIIKELK